MRGGTVRLSIALSFMSGTANASRNVEVMETPLRLVPRPAATLAESELEPAFLHIHGRSGMITFRIPPGMAVEAMLKELSDMFPVPVPGIGGHLEREPHR